MPFIMIAVLIDMISIGIIVPVLPMLVGTFTGSQADQALWLGVVAFAFGFTNFFAAPLLGTLSDRYGRRPVLLLGFCGLAFSFFATALATSMWMLVAVRAIGGAMQANVAVANAYVADISDPQQRARRFGLLGAMFGVGFVIGPALGGCSVRSTCGCRSSRPAGSRWPTSRTAAFVLPESLPLARRRPFSWRGANPVGALRRLAALKGVGRLTGVIASVGLAQGILYTTWVLYTTFKFGWTPADNGWSLATVGVMSVIVQGWLLGKLLQAGRCAAARAARSGLVDGRVRTVGRREQPAG